MRVLAARLPLLLKELQEQAVRPRTFISRVLFAIVAYGTFTIWFVEEVSGQGANALGAGDDLFLVVVVLQFIAVMVILPTLLAGSIAQEKESDTLQLLVVSRLSAWTIVWQKLLAKLIPFLGYLALTFPLLGLAFSLGGVESHQLVSLAYLMVLTAFHVGALSILVSTYMATTVSAFISIFVLGFIFYLGPGLTVEAFRLGYRWENLAWSFFPAAAYAENYAQGPWAVAKATWHMWPGILAFLALARVVFYRRAFLRGRNPLRRWLSVLDSLAQAANRRIGGIRLGREGGVPDDRPVRWRELQRRGLDRPHHTVRMALLLIVPVTVFGILAFGAELRSSRDPWLSVAIFVLWGAAALTVTVMSANLVVAERARQTLEVLLTVPIPSREIIRDKLAPVFRWIAIFTIGFAILYAFDGWLEAQDISWRGDQLSSPIYFCSGVALVWVYLPMLAWVSMAIALGSKTRVRGTVTAVIVVTLWQFLPLLLTWLVALAVDVSRDEDIFLMMLTSPMIFIAYLEFSRDGFSLWSDYPLAPFVFVYGWHLLIWFLARTWCLTRATRKLGRAKIVRF